MWDSPTYVWEEKLRKTKTNLKPWAKKHFNPLSIEKKETIQQLQSLYQKLEESQVTEEDIVQERKLTSILHKVNKWEEEQWRLKSRSLWLKSGDQNTSHFHKQAKARLIKNRINEIKHQDGEITTNVEKIRRAANRHYKNLYSQEEEINIAVEEEMLKVIPTLITEQDNNLLLKRIKDSEILEAIWSLDPDKAPGPDRFTIHFFRQCWETIKKYLCRMIRGTKENTK